MKVQVKRIYSNKRTSGFKVTYQDKMPYFLKVFHHPLSLKGIASPLLSLSRPEREFKFSRILREKGFPVPNVLKFYCRRVGGIFPLNIGYTKSIYLEGLVTLDKLTPNKNFEKFLEESILLLARLHRSGFIHKDISLSNLGIYNGKVFMIDLEGVYRSFPTPLVKWKNLVNFINDVLKHKVKFNAEEILNLYLKETKTGIIGKNYLYSKIVNLIEKQAKKLTEEEI